MMMRKTLEDIIPPSRRTAIAPAEKEAPSAPQTPPPTERPPRQRTSFSASYLPAIVAFAVIVLSGAALFVFSGARVEVDPMTATANISNTFSASTAAASSTAPAPLPFAVVSVKKVASQAVSASGTETVNQPAQGTITIYNAQTKVQKLVANTRFAASNGLIFRIHEAVSVPAAHGIVPGSVTATVYADAPGTQYNIGPSAFTLPGLAGSALASKVYAKSTEAMTGGFSGTRAQVPAEAEASTRATLRTALEKDLANAIKSQVPPDYVLLTGAATSTYADLPTQPGSKSDEANVQEEGTMTAVVFPSAALAKAVATNISGTYSGQPVTLADTSGLTLVPAHGIPASQSDSGKTFDFSLSGSVTVVWTVDQNRIAAAVAGKTRDEAQTVLKGFPEVKQAYLTLRPFWASAFPEEPADITVVVDAPKVAAVD